MTRSLNGVTVLFSALLLTACTQNPVEIALKGQQTFGKNTTFMTRNSTAYNALEPAAAPVQSVPVNSIGVSELGAPEQPKKAEALPKTDALATHQAINPWTGKKREAFSDAESGESISLLHKDNRGKAVKLSGANHSAFIWPVSGSKVISGFGPKGSGKVNDGINIAADSGEPVWAAADGEIVYAGNELEGYGNMVIVKHAGNKTTTYAHLSQAIVDKYDRVKQGDIIGYVGATGNVKSSQLHFAIRDGKEAVDPTKYMSRSLAGL